jgi:hypothetical protein
MLRFAAAGVLAAGLAWGASRLHAHEAHGRAASFTLLAGAAFGVILQRSRFCFAAAFRDLFLLRDRRVALGVLAALASGSVGYLVVFGAQLPDPSRYLPPTAHVAPVGFHLLLGGLSFGTGMVLAGGCLSGSLYRLGEGSLVAPTALAGAVLGYGIAFHAWEGIYLKAVAAGPVVWLPRSLGYAGALVVQLGVLAALAALLLWKCPGLPPRPGEAATLRSALRRTFVDGWPAWVGGIAVGALATFAFFRTSPLGVTSELGRLSHLLGKRYGLVPAELLGLNKLPGCRPVDADVSLTPNAIFVGALVVGSAVAALLAGEFKWRLGRPRTHALAAAGGVLLGFGAMVSLGCTVGTMLSGIMAFSLSGWLFAASLAGGAWLGTRLLRRLA